MNGVSNTVVANVVDFSIKDNSQVPNNKSYWNISINRKFESTQIKNEARILDGTFSLKDKVKTLNEYKTELEKATSTKERVKRAVITLLVVGTIVGGIA